MTCKAGEGLKVSETASVSSTALTESSNTSVPAPALADADLDCPSSLLSCSSICVVIECADGNGDSACTRSAERAGAGATLVMNSNSNAHSVYSAAKKQFLLQQTLQLCIGVVQMYLDKRNNIVQNSAPAAPCSEHESNRYALLTATAAEGLANVAYSAGPAVFNPWLMEVGKFILFWNTFSHYNFCTKHDYTVSVPPAGALG